MIKTLCLAARLVSIDKLASSEGRLEDYADTDQVIYWRKSIREGKRPVLEVRDLTKLSGSKLRTFKKAYPHAFNGRVRYLVSDGHHRLSAYQLEGISSIPVKVISDTVNE